MKPGVYSKLSVGRSLEIGDELVMNVRGNKAATTLEKLVVHLGSDDGPPLYKLALPADTADKKLELNNIADTESPSMFSRRP